MKKLLSLAIILVMSFAVISCDSGKKLSKSEKKAVEKVVHDYLVNNPEILIEMSKKLQQKGGAGGAGGPQAANPQQDAKTIADNKAALFNDKNTPFVGNPNGKLVVVEFFDYNCHFCRNVAPNVQRLIKENKDVKIVFKELPILGASSQVAARTALVVHDTAPKKYFDYYVALMSHEGQKDEAALVGMLNKLGLNGKSILEKAKDDKYAKLIADNQALAGKLGIRGTPAFVLNDKLVRGAVDYDQMKAILTSK
jgi:protein-disulfide isomerase